MNRQRSVLARRIVGGLWCWYVIVRWPAVERYRNGDFKNGRAFFEPTRTGYCFRNWRAGHGWLCPK